MGKQRRTRTRPRPSESGGATTSGFVDDDDGAAGRRDAASSLLPTTAAAPDKHDAHADGDDDTSTTGPRSSASSSSAEGTDAPAEEAPPIPFWPCLIPGALFCFQLFGFNPILGQYLNQVRGRGQQGRRAVCACLGTG